MATYPQRFVAKTAAVPLDTDSSNITAQFVPTELERLPKSGGHLYRWNVLPGLDHLEIATADVGTLGKLLLREVGQISETIDVLAKFDTRGFTHLLTMQRTTRTESEAYYALRLTSEVSQSNKGCVIVSALPRDGAFGGRQNAVKIGFNGKI